MARIAAGFAIRLHDRHDGSRVSRGPRRTATIAGNGRWIEEEAMVDVRAASFLRGGERAGGTTASPLLG
jgi:hypothetical protein